MRVRGGGKFVSRQTASSRPPPPNHPHNPWWLLSCSLSLSLSHSLSLVAAAQLQEGLMMQRRVVERASVLDGSSAGCTQDPAGQLEAVRMRCVVCFLPFSTDAAAELDDAAASSYRWLSAWRGLHADAAIRPRGHPSALYAHRDCAAIISQSLGEPVTYADLWPSVQETLDAKSSTPPDCLAPHSYHLPGLATGGGVLAVSSTAGEWALHSPLACTRSAARVLAVWSPRLQLRPSGHRLSFWRQALATRLQQVQAGAHQQQQQHTPTTTSTAPDLLSILIAHPAFHSHTMLAKLHMTSRGTAARIRVVLSGRLRLGFATSSTESALSFALWLTRHAGLLAALTVSVNVCCCIEDADTCQTAMAGAVRAARTLNPRMQLVTARGQGKA